jgi:carboxypeptidase T
MLTKRFLILCSISLIFGYILSSSAVFSPVRADFAQLFSTDQAPLPPLILDTSTNTFWVVRAYYQDQQMVNDLASWLEPWEVHHVQGYIVVGVDKEQYDRLLDAGFRLEIDPLLTAQMNQPHLALPGQTSGIPGYPCYRTVEETLAEIDSIVAAYPTLASKIDIGDSWDKTEPGAPSGYDLVVLKLTNSAVPMPKPKAFIMGSIHAREYAPAELATRFALQLVSQYGINADITWLLDYHEIHLLLQSNPDGRKQAETGLSWRKNTNQNYCSPIPNYRGADLNRNFSFQWGCCNGSSPNECDITYRGPSAASEPETQAVQTYVRNQFPDLRGPGLGDPAPADASGIFLDLHSYSELVLWPWGFTYAGAPNQTALRTLGRKFAYFNQYYPEQASGLYITDGSTDDFAYGERGVAAFTFELGTSFFQDCSTFENTILPNNLPALIYAAKASRTPYLTPAGPDITSLPDNLEAQSGSSLYLQATVNDTRYNSQNGTEPSQNIAAAEYYIDTPPWVTSPTPVAHPMAASDGAFNQKIESVNALVDTQGLSIGRHTLFVRGLDAAGNWGAVSAAFLQVTAPDYLFSLLPDTSLQGGDAGGSITHTLQLANLGLLADTYTITLNSAWPAVIYTPQGALPSGGSFSLDSGQSSTLQIVFTAPSQGAPGDRDDSQLMVISQGQPTLSQFTNLASVIWWRFFMPWVVRS